MNYDPATTLVWHDGTWKHFSGVTIKYGNPVINCVIALLRYCVIMLLHYYVIALLCYCIIMLLRYYVIALLCYCVIMLLRYYVIMLLRRAIRVPME